VIVEMLAWSGALLSCLLSIPQAVQVLTTDRLDGVSAATYWIVLANATVWASWSILAAEYAAGVPSLVNGPAAVLILARLRRARLRAPRIGVPTSAPANPVDPRMVRPRIVRTLGRGETGAGRMAAARPGRSAQNGQPEPRGAPKVSLATLLRS
jgi:uncharacterized protein with PQ loop repeat